MNSPTRFDRQKAKRPTLSLAPRFTIEVAASLPGHDEAADEAAFWEVFELAEALQKEGGYAPPDYEKMVADVYSIMRQGMTYLARLPAVDDEPGEVIGLLMMEEVAFRYSRTTFLADAGLYVKPQYRRATVASALLKRAREEGERRAKLVWIFITSPDRRQKQSTEPAMIAQMAGFVPRGYVLQLYPRKRAQLAEAAPPGATPTE